MLRYIRTVNGISDSLRFVGFAFLAITFCTMYEMIARAFFKSPTVWAWDINHQLLALTMIMAGAYTLFHKLHVSLDMFSSHWSTKTKAFVDLFTCFLPLFFLVALLISTGKLAEYSIVRKEAALGLFQIPVYPLRVIIVIGIFLQLIQLIADLMHSYLVVTGKVKTADEEGKGKKEYVA
jgi:TRAP-type mannitol/chloroaromatic compound transport system permease small subunit